MTIRNQILSVFAASFILTSILAFAFVNFTNNTSADLEELNDVELVLLNDAWEIKWLDEVLTQTSARYIQSKGDPVWEDRYMSHVDLLDAAFASAAELATSEEFAIFDDVSSSNAALVDYETRIFTLVGEGATLADVATADVKFQEANDILYGDYVSHKQIYSSGMQEFFDKQQNRIESNLQDQITQANTNRTTAIILAVVILITNVGLVFSLQGRLLQGLMR